LSEQVVEDLEEDETPSVPEDDGEQSQEDTAEEQVADDAKKLQKALGRERAAKKKALADLAALRKEAQQGDPNKGEMEKLTEQVAKLQQSIATKDRVTALLEAGFNQSSDKAERMLRMVDNFDDDEWIEELKVDYPERFGKRGTRPDGQRPFTNGGRDDTRGKQLTAEERHAAKLMGTYRRS
jgi:hypothetical protein